MTCADNNLASTVLSLFEGGVAKYGFPLKIRSDHGLENLYAARYMVQHRGTGRGSVLIGRSVHNVRVERLHRDVYSGVLCHYASLSSHMEKEGILNADNEEHLSALHHVFMRRINRSLEEFVNQWNSHPVSSAHHQSPEQMFIAGSLDAASDPSRSTQCPMVDSSKTLGAGFDDDELPQTNYAINDEDYAVFNIPNINILIIFLLQDDGNHGINHFLSCLALLHAWTHNKMNNIFVIKFYHSY